MKKLLALVLLLSSCGIKANPEVLKPPEVQIKRIGSSVYVKSLSGEIRIKGFEKVGDYWIKENPEGFCFLVERLGERAKKFCVSQALKDKPSIRLVEHGDLIKVIPSGFEAYRLYAFKDGIILLESGRTFVESIELHRDYWERCYALTGLKGDIESEQVEVCIKPKPPPEVPEVENLELRVGEQALYLVWFYKHEHKEFVVYKDGEEIGRTKGFSFEIDIPKAKASFTVKVISPLGFESKGKSLDYSP